MADDDQAQFSFAISLSVLNHLGRNLYRNFITVLGEAISNSWDADAKNIWIDFDKDESFLTIKDDGLGMDANDFQGKFLKIGYSKRKDGDDKTDRGRPFIGAKGIGKLALLSCASRVTIFSKKEDGEYIGGVIDNSGLDAAITDNLNPDEYPLEAPDISLIDKLVDGHTQGTILAFEGAKELLRVSDEQIRKLLALSFHFSLIDPEFTIHVNGTPISVKDLESLATATEFVWKIAEYNDDFLETCSNVKRWADAPETKLQISGYLATVEKPSNLNVRGAESRATVDLFVHGRLRERNVLRHIPTQRIVESYLYGQIHFDVMGGDGDSPFTSSREGIVETDPNFQALMDYLKKELIPRIIDQWDEFRLARGEDGDEENPRRTKRQRKAAGLVHAIEQEFKTDDGDAANQPAQDVVDEWLTILRPDAEFNVDAYVDCFLSENLIRKYMKEYKIAVTPVAQKDIDKWKGREAEALADANINFDVRKDGDDLSYLDMDKLAVCAEGAKSKSGKTTPLVQNALSFKPVRNAVGHTGVLTDNAKTHLTLTLENLKGRLRKLLNAGAP
jgi:hypothetical protein